ncbi:CBS domain-containing protein [Microvirga sp. TS319]|uniref:CBS domain-containing protein n=1 Tax=Microvirga sp. TS319 TaxID=3241165 RepID=UPI00351A38D1
MSDVIIAMTSCRFGCAGVITSDGTLSSIVTGGDPRWNMDGLLERTVEAVMTRAPLTVSSEALGSRALEIMNCERITALFIVVDGKPIGIVHIHDLLRAGLA